MSTATQKVKAGVPLKLAGWDDIFPRMSEVYEAISRRAFEIFEGKGAIPGHDLEDWFQAESELLHPVPIEVKESTDRLIVQAEVPDFGADDLKISVQPCRLVIFGYKESKAKHKGKKTVRREEILRAVTLPAEVDPERTTATLKGALLEVLMPKTRPAQKGRVVPIS